TMFQTAWNTYIKPAWNSLGTGIKTIWDKVIKPAWDALKKGLTSIRDAFKTAVDNIKKVWDGLRAAAAKPVNFVIGIYNNHIVGLLQKLAGFVGLKNAVPGKINPVQFSKGGIVPGY